MAQRDPRPKPNANANEDKPVLSMDQILEFLQRHEQKRMLRFVTIGSVDDGKSTLIGRLLHDTGMVYEDQPVTFLVWLDGFGAIDKRFQEAAMSPFTPMLHSERWHVAPDQVLRR